MLVLHAGAAAGVSHTVAVTDRDHAAGCNAADPKMAFAIPNESTSRKA